MRRKVFTDNDGKLIVRVGPGEYRYINRSDLAGNAVLAADHTLLDSLKTMGALPAEIDLVADISAMLTQLTADGAIPITARYVELDHISVVVAATMAAPPTNCLMFFKNTSASGTIAHTVTLTGGTFDGSGTIITLDAPGEMIGIYFDSAGDGTEVANVGTVVVS